MVEYTDTLLLAALRRLCLDKHLPVLFLSRDDFGVELELHSLLGKCLLELLPA
jgi:hypothetical protein